MAEETSWWDDLTSGIGELGDNVWDYVTDVDEGLVGDAIGLVTKDDGSIDWGTIATIGGGVAGALGLFDPEQKRAGYQGGIPSYTAVREQVPMEYDPDRRPGSGGRRYFTDVQYTAPDQAAAARTAAQETATGLAALNAANPANQTRPVAPAPRQPATQTPAEAASKVIERRPIPQQEGLENFTPKYATGGIAAMQPSKGYYLGGITDGMADKVPATIDNQQPAALSDGEFVIPADVVSHLGNGNSNAGAKQLYSMMDKVRQERTGTKKQGKEINPNKFMPA